MVRKIIRTTQQRIVSDKAGPVETIHEREVVRPLRGPDGVLVYESSKTLPEFDSSLPAVATRNEIEALHSSMRVQEGWTQQQSALLRDVDYRLKYLEAANRGWGATYAVEHATWWTLWYILMLVLFSALVVVVILISLSLMH